MSDQISPIPTDEKNKLSLHTLLEMFSHLHSVRRDWKMLSFLLVLVVVCISSEPYFFRWLIGTIENKEGIYQLGIVVGIWSLFAVCTIVFRYMYGMRLLHAAVHDWGDFLMNIMSKIQSLPIEYHRNIQAGEKQKIVDRSAEAVWAVADNYILAVLPQVLVFVVLVISGIYIDPVFTGICLAFLPVGIYGVFYLGRTAHTNQRAANKAWDKMFDRLIDGIINLPVIRIFGRTGTEYSLMKEYMQIGNAAQYKVRKNWSQFNAFGRFFTIIAKMITISAGGYMIYTGRADYATFFFFIAFTDRIYSPIMEIFNVVQSTMKDIAYYEKAKDVFVMESEGDTGKYILGNIHTGISFRDMSFSYPSNTREVLSHISLDIPKWQRIALIWHTGSGKSTIVQLLMRFYAPTQGSIHIDGVDIYDYTLQSYRESFAAVFQDTTLFNETIGHNLRYVRDGISDADIERACTQANIWEFVQSLPDGLDTQVGERGLKLSGWEKQRIAIARTILADPQVLILDEATSALDTRTERLVQGAFDALMDGRTSIIIAHRLSTIVSADMIYMLDHGQIVAKGTHTELYATCTEYREMVDMQHDGYIGEEESM